MKNRAMTQMFHNDCTLYHVEYDIFGKSEPQRAMFFAKSEAEAFLALISEIRYYSNAKIFSTHNIELIGYAKRV